MTEQIKAIETRYNGYKFRSRLEARWAVFFDELGIKYEYEPEGYTLEDGTKYLPDFLIFVRHRSYEDEWDPVFVEVKGVLGPNDLHKVEMLSKVHPVLLLGSMPADDDEYMRVWRETGCFHSFVYMDGDDYPACFCIHKGVQWLAGPDHDQWDDGAAMNRALLKARYARFEHGECG